MERGAVISDDGLFRTRLWRIWDHELPRVLWVMLNPSWADGSVDDRTVLTITEFTKLWGRFGGLEVGNLYAYRSESPAVLKQQGYPIGPGNDDVLRALLRQVLETQSIVVTAWGSHAQKERAAWFKSQAEQMGVPLYYLKLNKDGSPGHPLYLRRDTERQEWLW